MPEHDAPQSRNEAILQNILGEHNELIEPQSRNEAILQAILYGDSYTEDAQSRIETLLLCILNGTTTDLQPLSRNEEILIAKINGGTYDKEPQSRIEELLIEWLNAFVEKTVTGAVCSFDDAIAGQPLIDLTAQIVAVQSGSGDPSPSNVRPISGFTGVNVTRTGKNFFNPSTVFSEVGSYLCAMNITPNAVCNISFIDKDTSVSLSGIYFGFVNSNYSGGTLPSDGYRWCIENGVVQTTKINTRQGNILTGLVAYPKNQTTIDTILARYNIQIEIGESATEYEPYIAPTTYSVTWQTEASTVYGGSIDLTTGVLTVTHGIVVYNGSEADWDNYNAQNGFYRALPEMSGGNWQSGLCDKFKVGTGDASVQCIRLGASNSYIYFNHIKDSIAGISSLATWKTWLASNNVTVVYPLATPQTYQLTPTEVKTLLGVNNIYSNTGNSTVKYKARG